MLMMHLNLARILGGLEYFALVARCLEPGVGGTLYDVQT